MILENVREGFDGCPMFFVEGSAEKLLQFLKTCFVENPSAAYADFYYGRLTEEQKEAFQEELRLEEAQQLEAFVTDTREVFYPLTEENLVFLANITARSLLFSTFYFGVHPCTVWGNYDRRYPVFCKSEEDKLFYERIAEQCEVLGQ